MKYNVIILHDQLLQEYRILIPNGTTTTYFYNNHFVHKKNLNWGINKKRYVALKNYIRLRETTIWINGGTRDDVTFDYEIYNKYSYNNDSSLNNFT